MTDRRTGSVGVVVDLQRTGITVNRQTGAAGVNVDLAVNHSIPVVEVWTGSVGVNVDLQRTGIILNRETGSVGVNVDLQILTSVDAVTWSGSAFGIGGAFPDVHWSSGKFQSASGPRVLWDATAGTFTLEGV